MMQEDPTSSRSGNRKRGREKSIDSLATTCKSLKKAVCDNSDKYSSSSDKLNTGLSPSRINSKQLPCLPGEEWLRELNIFRFPFLKPQVAVKGANAQTKEQLMQHIQKAESDLNVFKQLSSESRTLARSACTQLQHKIEDCKKRLEENVSSSACSAPHLQQDMNNERFPKWAPRDCWYIEEAKDRLHLVSDPQLLIQPAAAAASSSTIAIANLTALQRFSAIGFDHYQIAISLVGSGDTAAPDVLANKFVRAGYSYVHLSFRQLVSHLERLRPEDRFLTYIVPANTPVHLYFDLDGDFGLFEHLKSQHEGEVIQSFLWYLSRYFLLYFARNIDLSGLLLLQATSHKKVSWHVHVTSEAFQSNNHLKLFVESFIDYVKSHKFGVMHATTDTRTSRHLGTQPELAIGSHPVDMDTEKDPSTNNWQPLPMCVKGVGDATVCMIDHRVYNGNQNFRCPYNKKPGGVPLLPRDFHLQDDGQVNLAAVTPSAGIICERTLFRAHPALALPDSLEYAFLSESAGSVRMRFRLKPSGKPSGKHCKEHPTRSTVYQKKRWTPRRGFSSDEEECISVETGIDGAAAALSSDVPMSNRAAFFSGSNIDTQSVSEDHGSQFPPPASSSTSSAPTTRPNTYQYTPLQQLKNFIGQRVNVYGVVLSVGRVKPPSRGPDFMLNVMLADSSMLNPMLGVSINIFRKQEDELPAQCLRGDIMRLHRVEITDGTRFGRDIMGGMPQKTSSFVCIRGGMNDGYIPFVQSSQSMRCNNNSNFQS
jgi:hypothetical protein